MVEVSGVQAQLPLLHYRFRYAGFILIILGFGAAYLYFWGGRPQFFEVPVFAIVTSYLETRWFVAAQTNSLDEIAFLFILFGLIAIGFSKTRTENPDTHQIRIKTIFYSVYITSAIWGIVYLTVYGWPVFAVSAFMFAVFILIHNTLLWVQFLRSSKKNHSSKNQNSGVI